MHRFDSGRRLQFSLRAADAPASVYYLWRRTQGAKGQVCKTFIGGSSPPGASTFQRTAKAPMTDVAGAFCLRFRGVLRQRVLKNSDLAAVRCYQMDRLFIEPPNSPFNRLPVCQDKQQHLALITKLDQFCRMQENAFFAIVAFQKSLLFRDARPGGGYARLAGRAPAGREAPLLARPDDGRTAGTGGCLGAMRRFPAVVFALLNLSDLFVANLHSVI